jgi:hypothetical protein
MTPKAKPIILIPDNGPLGALAINQALDCLFDLGAPIHITDVVIEEATRNKDLWWNTEISKWLARNDNRYTVIETETGREWRKAIALWEAAGSPPELEPSSSDKGDLSILELVETYENKMEPDETIIAIVDDAKLRKRLSRSDVNIDLISTRALFSIIEKDLHKDNAESMWMLVRLANPTADPRNEIMSVRNIKFTDGGIAAPYDPKPK